MYKLLLPFIFFTNIPFMTRGQVDTRDSLALVDFYNNTNGSHWQYTFWPSSRPVSHWSGVTVTDNRVTSIWMSGENIEGQIPESFGDLTELTDVQISFCNLTGPLPESIGKLKKLVGLNLNSCHISGPLPASLGNLSSLSILSLYANDVDGSIPSSIGNLTNLTRLDLYNNRLTGNIPEEIGNLKQLSFLELAGNPLSGTIPASMGNLLNLKVFLMWRTNISGSLPSSLGNLPNLEDLELDRNKLTGTIPSSFDNLSKKIYNLQLNGNSLTGEIPSSLGDSSKLYMYLHNNSFTFASLEKLLQGNAHIQYFPQHSIPLYFNDSTIWVNAGGTLSNNTYQLYKNGTLLSTQIGDSLFKVGGYNSTDSFSISVTNSIATKLTLYSDTVQVKLTYYTVKNGNWSDATIWSGGSVPPVTASVLIRNNVAINQDVTCYAVKVEPPTGSINVLAGVHFRVTH